MYKYILSVAICFVLLSSCEPNTATPEPEFPLVQQPSDGQDGDPVPSPGDAVPDSVLESLLSEINTLRTTGCSCGENLMKAAVALRWNSQLYAAALAHAADMQARSYFSHTSPDGENVYHRLTRAGYISDAWRVISYGENIAYGDFDVPTLVEKWIESPSHCVNLMRETYRETAIAHAGRYWVQVFGARREDP